MGLSDTFFAGSTPPPGGRALPNPDDEDDDLTPPTVQPAIPAPPSQPPVRTAAAAQPAPDDEDDSPSAPAIPAASSFAVPTVPRPPKNRFNYTALADNPVLAQTFAPEIEQERQYQAQEAVNAKADAVTAQRAANARMQTTAQTTGLRTTRDGAGNVIPLTDPDSGKPLYKPHTGDVQYDPKTGKPFQDSRDQFGQITRTNPDADAPVGPNADDPSDPQLYRQNKYQGWQPIGHVNDLAGDKTQDPDVRKTAQRWQQQRGKLIAQTAVQTAERTAANAQAAHMGAQSQVETLTTQNTAIQTQLDALDADPNANATSGGFLGMGAKPTDAATSIAAKRANLEQQQAALQTQLQAAKAQIPVLEATAKSATADAAITRHGLDLTNYATLADQRRALLKTEGKSADNDPVLAAIVKKTSDLNVKLGAARESKAALTPAIPTSSSPQLGQPAPDPSSTPVEQPPAQPSAATPPQAASPLSPPAEQSSPSAQPTPFTLGGQAAPGSDALTSRLTDQSAPPAPKPSFEDRARNDAAQVTAGVLNTPFDAGRAFWLSAAAGTDVATPEQRNQESQHHVAELQSTLGDFVKRKANPRYKSDPNFRLNVDEAIKRTQASIAQRQNTPPDQPLSPGDEKKAQFFRDLSTQSRAYADDEKSTTERVKANVGVDPKQAGNTDSRIFAGLGALPKILIPGGIGPVLMLGDTKSSAYDAEMARLQPQVDSGAMPAHEAERAADTASTVKTLEQLPTLAAYGLNGKLASTAVKSILARTQISSPLWRAAAEGAGALAANVTTSTGVRAAEAALSEDPKAWDNVLPSWESLFSGDLPFALIHGAHALGEGRAQNAAVAEGQAHLNMQAARLAAITPATAEEHVAIPLRPATPEADQANAAVAANFASRNPDAPKIDPSVVAKAREFAPVGEEQTTGVALKAADQQIEQLESGLAAIPAGDPQRRIQQQAQLAQAYQSKAALVNQQDARLLSVQQISALPDWTPPVDPTTQQPTEAPDPNRTRETAGALLKITNGFQTDDLTASEQTRLKPAKGDPALVRKAPDGSTILTDAGRQQLATVSPAAGTLIAGGEAQDIRARAQQAASNEVEKTNIGKEQAGDKSTPEDENVPETGQNVSEPGASASKSPLADRILGRIRDQVATGGKELTHDQNQAAQKYAGTAADNLTTSLQKYQRAFRSVGLDIVDEHGVDSGGVHSPGAGEIRLSLQDIIHPDNLRALQDPARADRAIQEEAIHAVAQHLEARGEINPTAVWHSLPPVLQRRVQSVYGDEQNPRNLGHEVLRQIVQGKLNMTAKGWTDANGHLLTEQTDPGLMAVARQSVFKLLKFFKDLHGSLLRAGAKPEDAQVIADSADRLHKAVRGVIDGGSASSDAPADAQRPPESGRNEPPGPGEGIARQSAGDPEAARRANAGQAEENPAEQRLPSDEERARAAAGLGVDPSQIGHVSEVTSSTGQRVRTAFVVREAADARPSHNPEGVPTPGYPQDFQPRDRSGVAYRRQAQNIAGDLDLDRLADSPRPDEGSPIVTASGHTLTGNGRDIALGLAHRDGLPAAGKYKARLFQRAPEFGLNRATVARLKQPVLHRVILGHESPDSLRRFSEDSNASPAMQSNSLETAAQDARRLTPALLSTFDPNYDLESPKNANFLKAFGQQVILGKTRVGDGNANELNVAPSDLAKRARLSLFAAAYGGDPAGRAALERMGGDTEDRGRNISQALLTLAPVMARLRADTATGDSHPGYDISTPLVRAAQEISEAVANRPPKQSAAAAIDGLLAQQTFDADPLERAALGFFARNRANRSALEEGLSHFAESVYGLGNPKDGADMFGDRQLPNVMQLFLKAASPTLSSRRAVERPNAAEETRRSILDKASADASEGERVRVSTTPSPYRPEPGGTLNLPAPRADLTPELRRAEATIRAIANDPRTADTAYDRIPESHGGKVIGTDIARELLPEYAAGREGKIQWVNATGQVGSIYARDRVFRELANRGDRHVLLMTAGGVAAGKSVSIQPEVVKAADLIYDGTMRETGETKRMIDAALANGWKVRIEYVQRPIGLVAEGAIDRADKSGRWGPLAQLPSIHRAAQASAVEIAEAYRNNPDVQFNATLNEGTSEHPRPGQNMALSEIAPGGRLHYDEEYERQGNRSVRDAYARARNAGTADPRILDLIGRGMEGAGREDRGSGSPSVLEGPAGTGRPDKVDPSLASLRARPVDDSSETSSSHPVDDLLRLFDEGERGEATDRLQGKAAAEQPGQRTVGRPDLAFGGASDAHRAVDQQRADEHLAQTHDQWNAEADHRFQADPQGEVRNLAAKALTGDQLDAVETKIAQRAVAAELTRPDSPEQRRKVQAMIYGYRMTGTEQARAMAARFDPHQTPIERHREYLGKTIFTPPAEVQRKLDALPKGDKAGRQAILDADQQRVTRIEGELKKMGVSFDDIFRGEIQLRLKGAKVIDNTASQLFDGARQRALKLLQGGARSFADVARAVNLSEGDVKTAYNQMREALKAKLRDKVRRGVTAENLDMQASLLSRPAEGATGRPEPTLKSDAETDAELERILNQMGFADPAKVGKMKVRQPKKAIFRPPAAPVDPAQFEAWKRGGVGDDVRTKVPVGQREVDFGQRPSVAGTGERADARFTKPRGDEQGRMDFPGQEPAPGGGTGERAGGKFLQGEQGRMDIDDGPPVMSGIDLSDPVQATRIGRAIQAADSNVYDKAFEMWSAGLLSGPQTHIAIGVGNTLNAGFELTAQRGMEALLNLAYRDPNAAQFGELKYILRGMLPGLREGLAVGLKSFRAEASMFEPTFLDQQLALDPGEHLNAGHKVAIGGKLGKVVRLPFRAVGFMDGFMKTSIWHMQVAAEAYRMAKAEGLKGGFLAKRMEELSAPGSEAAIRAGTRAQEMIGQAPYLADHSKQQADDHVKRVDAAYAQARAEGKTGDGITGRATELLRAPDTGGWRRFVPPGIEHNPLDVVMDKFHEMARSTKLLSYAFPYLRMPYNLMKMGLRKSPLGVTNIAARLINGGLYKLKEGKPMFQSYPAALQTRHLAEQAFAWTAAAALYSAVEGDGEDDRKKRFLITGSRSFIEDRKGQRDLLERTAGGAMTMRVGNTTVNYGRYEPIATVLATVADAVRTIKAMHNGAGKSEAVDKFVGYVSDQVMSKTMLQGMADLQKDIAGGAGTADRVKRAMMTALVPNIIRQPLRNLDDYVRDSHGAPSPYSFFPAGGFAEKKLTPYGQPVEKTGNPLSCILFPAATKPTERLSNADRLLMNWNEKHPGEAWAPEPLSRKKTDLKTGKQVDMSNEEYTAFQRRAALKVNTRLAGIINSSNASHPKEDDIHALKKAFMEAHREAKEEAFGTKKDPVAVAPLPKRAPGQGMDISRMMGLAP